MFAVVVVVVYLLLILEFKSLPLSLSPFPSLNSLSTSVGLDNDRHLGARNGRPEGGCHTHLHIRDGRHEIELCQVLQRGQRVLQVNNNKWTKSRSILTHASVHPICHAQVLAHDVPLNHGIPRGWGAPEGGPVVRVQQENLQRRAGQFEAQIHRFLSLRNLRRRARIPRRARDGQHDSRG